MDLMKVLGLLVLHHVKEQLFRNMSFFQRAYKLGHYASEHFYFLKTVVLENIVNKKSLLATSYDVEKFYYSLDKYDMMLEL